jgi:hypothetical protein
VAAAAGAGGGSSAGPANDFARSLPVMPRKSRASPALSKSRKRKSSVASDKDSDSEAESADVMTMLVSHRDYVFGVICEHTLRLHHVNLIEWLTSIMILHTSSTCCCRPRCRR